MPQKRRMGRAAGREDNSSLTRSLHYRSVQADASSQHEDLSDLFQRFHIIEGEIVIIGYKEQQNTFAERQKSPDRHDAAKSPGCLCGQISIVEPCHEIAQQAENPIDIHMVAFQHGGSPENVSEGDQQRNTEQDYDTAGQTAFPYLTADALRGDAEKGQKQDGEVEQDAVEGDEGKLVGHGRVTHKKFADAVEGFQRLESGKEAAVMALICDRELIGLSEFKGIVKAGVIVQHEKHTHNHIGRGSEKQLFSKPERELSVL